MSLQFTVVWLNSVRPTFNFELQQMQQNATDKKNVQLVNLSSSRTYIVEEASQYMDTKMQ